MHQADGEVVSWFVVLPSGAQLKVGSEYWDYQRGILGDCIGSILGAYLGLYKGSYNGIWGLYRDSHIWGLHKDSYRDLTPYSPLSTCKFIFSWVCLTNKKGPSWARRRECHIVFWGKRRGFRVKGSGFRVKG